MSLIRQNVVMMFTGCVERGNGDLQIKLGKWMDIHGSEWTKGLKLVVHSMNTSMSGTTGRTPYELVFGQKARSDQGVWEELAAQGVLNEEDLPEEFVERFNSSQQPGEEAAVVQPVDGTAVQLVEGMQSNIHINYVFF